MPDATTEIPIPTSFLSSDSTAVMPTQIAIVNVSATVTPDELELIARAIHLQVFNDFGPVWLARQVAVFALPKGEEVPPDVYPIYIFDSADHPGFLGFHEQMKDIPYSRIFVAPIISNGGTVHTGELSISAVVSHEALEMLADMRANYWAMSGFGVLYALEVSDAVEEQSYEVDVNGTKVSVSNFVTPAWFDPQAPSTAKFDMMGQVMAPFAITPGGYAITLTAGQVSNVYGEKYAPWRKTTKLHARARTFLRGATHLVQISEESSLYETELPETLPEIPNVPSIPPPAATLTADELAAAQDSPKSKRTKK